MVLHYIVEHDFPREYRVLAGLNKAVLEVLEEDLFIQTHAANFST